jgi:hypothetical protein
MKTPKTDDLASDGWSGDAMCVSADFARQLERELEWLYAHCRIVYYPPDGSYPIEHAPLARKDARWLLDQARDQWSNAESIHPETKP